MKTFIKRREQNEKLLIVFSGWGNDEKMFTPFCPEDWDFILFYNYSADEALVLPESKQYKKTVLMGWSLGVWATEYLSFKTGLKADITIAINGTPVPADDRYGIPLKVFEGTLNNISEHNMEKFYLRMFGDKKSLAANLERIPGRSIKSLHDELRWLYNRIMEQTEPGFRWDYAVISDIDRVFPSSNTLSYWKERKATKLIRVPYPHFFFHFWNSFDDFISFVEKGKRGLSKKRNRAIKDH